ncbi:TPA: His-Xaa-Ser system protein HxsD [Providencia stuartii]|uniref:His-Xaa-Ser system protein HxsD n=1 Tax=Providencia TaxID=586 RepID=UPI000909F2BA|nr:MULTISPECIES: His-Xaa-Ser system protein HxsD [Providencia]APG49967.1 His-Xaa-Ser system protein HxsD [Providencia stuartii]AVL40239.1 His-Xaa-Ser system protein HxsD [Providencia stuartii]MBG5903002.1 His-Xaa-Ser system protein HxsD [Providencia stuartii]MBG5911535.1 His-Xaa-Ser system protein HxsD [Providencia stuartii]MBG5914575.1 His-Xaa-Ser system protein HxsD [Providencia stuartii]
MNRLTLQKEQYSISVIRQSLYWMTSITEWTLTEKDTTYEVSFKDCNDDALFQFNRLLNDYTLREQIDIKTRDIRSSIMSKVLASIDERLSQ